jgi:hypothetical protein
LKEGDTMMQTQSRQKKQQIIQDWKTSKKSGKQYCIENNIKPSTFYSWLKSEKKESNKEPGFVQVPVTVPTAFNLSPIFLEFRDYRIHLTSGFDSELLKQTLLVLEAMHVS